jgi:hypothetical protein
MTFVDLGMSPLCESYLHDDQLNQMEPFYPLHVYVCEQCYLVQLLEYVSPEKIFSHYALLPRTLTPGCNMPKHIRRWL